MKRLYSFGYIIPIFIILLPTLFAEIREVNGDCWIYTEKEDNVKDFIFLWLLLGSLNILLLLNAYYTISVIRFLKVDVEIDPQVSKQVKRLIIFPLILIVCYLPILIVDFIESVS